MTSRKLTIISKFCTVESGPVIDPCADISLTDFQMSEVFDVVVQRKCIIPRTAVVDRLKVGNDTRYHPTTVIYVLRN